jgi:hypothetical protein
MHKTREPSVPAVLIAITFAGAQYRCLAIPATFSRVDDATN